ncbi:hypothetical protein [Ruminococcus sp.]|uniref:hypothetical protein n=1 Tax=Ruminococcus sp. TaxID=41978 RepID=UPI003F0615E2
MKLIFGCGRFLTIGAPEPRQVQLAKNAYLMTIPCVVLAVGRGLIGFVRFFRRSRS